jgi:hypothetical protein
LGTGYVWCDRHPVEEGVHNFFHNADVNGEKPVELVNFWHKVKNILIKKNFRSTPGMFGVTATPGKRVCITSFITLMLMEKNPLNFLHKGNILIKKNLRYAPGMFGVTATPGKRVCSALLATVERKAE